MEVVWKGSPNYTKGRSGHIPSLVVLHIMAGTLKGTDAWFANPASQVSAHYGIGQGGECHQYVDERNTAWANGRVANPTSKIVKKLGGNPNTYTISIEHEGYDLSKQPQKEIEASAVLVRDICSRWGIPIDRDHVVGHYEIYSLKPNCPAKDKKIIDKIIKLANNDNEEDMTLAKDLRDAFKKAFDRDYGDSFNENEQNEAAKKLIELYEQKQKVEVREVSKEVPVEKEVIKEVPVEKEVVKEVRVLESSMTATELLRLSVLKFLGINK